MPVGECLNFGQCLNVQLAAVFADAAQQRASGPTEGAASPTRILRAPISLPPLQNPLQRVIDDPPGHVELGYEANRRVRWDLEAVGAVSAARWDRRSLAHPLRSSLIAGGNGGTALNFLHRKCVRRTGSEQITRTFRGRRVCRLNELPV
jgi:hypothetical protein